MKKYSYLYEIPFCYLLLEIINRTFLPEAPGFIDIAPHPYWLGVLLFGFRYGILAGFLSGAFAAIQFLILNWFLGDPFHFEDAAFFAQPSLFIIFGTLIGFGIQRYRNIIQRLLKDKGVLEGCEAVLKEEVKTQQDIIGELERRIVTRMSTLVTLYEGARKLESSHHEELYQTIVNFISKTIEVEQAALYLKENDHFVLKQTWGGSESVAKSFVAGEGIGGFAAAHDKLVTLRDFLEPGETEEETTFRLKDCLMAAPLHQGEKGEVIGVLCIQRMPFLHFNSATINLFSFLTGWASRSLGRAAYIESLKAHEILDPEFGVYSYRYLQTRSHEEFQRSKTYYLPLTVGLVRVSGLETLSHDKRFSLQVVLIQLIRECCRATDILTRYPDEGWPLALLLVTTSPTQAQALRQKILEKFTALAFPATFRLEIGLASFSPQTKDFDSMLKTAKAETEHAAQKTA